LSPRHNDFPLKEVDLRSSRGLTLGVRAIIMKHRTKSLTESEIDMNQNILFIGMDVHKESIEIAIAEGNSQEVRRYGQIGGTRDAMRKTLRKLVSTQRATFLL